MSSLTHPSTNDLVAQVMRGDVPPPQRVEELLGAGRELWESDEEFETFLSGIAQRREESRSATVRT